MQTNMLPCTKDTQRGDRLKLIMNKAMVRQTVCFCMIRFLYTFITVTTLDGLYYAGAGSYHIAYDTGRDSAASFLFILIVLFYSMRPVWDDFMSIVLHLLMILYFIPMNAEYAIHDLPFSFLVLSSLYMIMMISVLTMKRGEAQKTGSDDSWLYDNRVVLFCMTVCLLFIAYKILYNGFSLTMTIDSDYVYSNRKNYNHAIAVFSGSAAGYIITLVHNLQSSLAPVLLFIGLRRKKVLYIFVAVLDFLSEFSLSSMKSTLFIPLIVIAVYTAGKLQWLKNYRKFFNRVFLAIFLFCFAESRFFSIGQFYFLLIRRVMYSPSWLNGLYYEYFSEHKKVWLTDSAFGLQRILPHVYEDSPVSIISEVYFGGIMDSPNTGLFGAAYMQLGITGIFVQPVLIYFILRWASKVLRGYGRGLVTAFACMTAMKMQNVPVLRTDFVISFAAVIFLLQWIRRIRIGSRGKPEIINTKINTQVRYVR